LRQRESVHYNLRESKVISVRHLTRSSRLRRAFLWSCVPYLFLSLFADLLHAHPLLSPGAPAIGIFHQVASAAAERPHRLPATSCAICKLQRVRPRLQARTGGTPTTLPTPTLVVPVSAAVPKSPIPHPSAFRGPPQAFFS